MSTIGRPTSHSQSDPGPATADTEDGPDSGKSEAPPDLAMGDRRFGPYRQGRLIGTGGSGLVYEALDEKQGHRVALKLLPMLQPRHLLRLKQEFRKLRRVCHRNLVALHELMSVDENCFIAMELIDGTDWLGFVRGADRRRVAAPLSADGELRLRATLPQLVEGVHHMHGCGLLHLDLKPENVLVERGGRVVVLDFGLTESFDEDPPTLPGRAGTPPYMSPEQCAAEPRSPASDWYSLGVMLYEALTGELPFPGAAEESMRARRITAAPDPCERFPSLPHDLAALCRQLLRPEPSERPLGPAILASFCAPLPDRANRRDVPKPSSLIGRDEQLAILRKALSNTDGGRCSLVQLRGGSGVGKTALVQAFLRSLASQGALLLTGRCHERETVSYKGFDSIVDSLCVYLRGAPREQLRALLDERAWSDLATVFPVLGDLPVMALGPAPPWRLVPSFEQRQLAFGSLRRLLGNLRSQRQVVLFIDDMQWADADVVPLLATLLAPPSPPPILLLFAHNTDVEHREDLRSALHTQQTQQGIEYENLTLVLDPLAPPHAEQLTASLLGTRDSPMLASAIASESGGNPFFIEQLVHAIDNAPAQGTTPSWSGSVEQLVTRRVEALSAASRRVLEVASLSSRPLPQGLIFQAAGIIADARTALLSLCSASLVRSAGLRDEDLIELYHNRIRECVLRTMGAALQQQRHLELALTLSSANASADMLAFHHHEAGDLVRACEYAERAGLEAEQVLAFERAAAFYRDALDWQQGPPERSRQLHQRRAVALLNAGRGADAASGFIAAAETTCGTARADQLRQAAGAYFTAGYIDDGLKVVERLFRELGEPYTRRPLALRWQVAKFFLQIRLRRSKVAERSADSTTQQELFTVDLYWSIGRGLCNVLPWEGMAFMLRSLRDALRVGEASRIARGLWYFGAVLVVLSSGNSAHGEQCLAQAAELGHRTNAPALIGQSRIGLSMRSLLLGRWAEALTQADEGILLMQQSPGLHWERTSCACNALVALEQLGRPLEVLGRAEQLLAEAITRGDLFAQCVFIEFTAFCRLVLGNPEQAKQHAQWVEQYWTRQTYTLQHFYAMRIQVYCHLYERNVAAAAKQFDKAWSFLGRSDLYRVNLSRMEICLLRARIALSQTQTESRPRSGRVSHGEQAVAVLEREERPDGRAHAALLRAALTLRSGDSRSAAVLLERSAQGFESLEMGLMAAAARLRQGQLRGDGAAVREATAKMRSLGLPNPLAWSRCCAPGFPDDTEST